MTRYIVFDDYCSVIRCRSMSDVRATMKACIEYWEEELHAWNEEEHEPGEFFGMRYPTWDTSVELHKGTLPFKRKADQIKY